MEKKDYDVELVEEWKCPAETGVPLITMPNIPRALHGLPPRKIMGQAAWDKVRKKCYYDAHYKCEICGADFAEIRPRYAAHELYSYDYKEGTGTFERCIAICAVCHDAIHSGRLITMFKNGNPLYPRDYVLKVVEKCFSLVSAYNKENDTNLKVYCTFLEYLKYPELFFEMVTLIAKYHIEFYGENHKTVAKWDKWRLVWNGKEYPTPYKTPEEWAEAMEARSQSDTRRLIGNRNPFNGEAYDAIDEILKNEL